MTPEDFLQKVKREQTISHVRAVELFPELIQKFEEKLVQSNKSGYTDSPKVFFSEKDFISKDINTIINLTEFLKEYLIGQGWLVSVKYPESYLMDAQTTFRLYTNTRKHRFYVWLQNTFNSTSSWDGY